MRPVNKLRDEVLAWSSVWSEVQMIHTMVQLMLSGWKLVRSWFKAGSKLVRSWFEAGSNLSATSFEPASVMEFGFYDISAEEVVKRPTSRR